MVRVSNWGEGHSWTAAAITAAVIIAKWGQMTSLITPTNGDAAVTIGNRRGDHEFVIIAPVFTNIKLLLILLSMVKLQQVEDQWLWTCLPAVLSAQHKMSKCRTVVLPVWIETDDDDDDDDDVSGSSWKGRESLSPELVECHRCSLWL